MVIYTNPPYIGFIHCISLWSLTKIFFPILRMEGKGREWKGRE
jgi:hypothetical protein